MSADNLMGQIRDFFGYTSLAEFARDWKQLDARSKEQIKSGIGNGTYDYDVEG